MDPVRKKACPVSLCMPDLEHLERIAMFLRPAAPAGASGAGGRRAAAKNFSPGRPGVYISQ